MAARKIIDGVSLPLPPTGSIAHAIIGSMQEEWHRAAAICNRVPPEITKNPQSKLVVICQLTADGYLTRRYPPRSRGRRADQEFALTEAGREVRDYINSPPRPATGGKGHNSSPTTSG